MILSLVFCNASKFVIVSSLSSLCLVISISCEGQCSFPFCLPVRSLCLSGLSVSRLCGCLVPCLVSLVRIQFWFLCLSRVDPVIISLCFILLSLRSVMPTCLFISDTCIKFTCLSLGLGVCTTYSFILILPSLVFSFASTVL